MENLERITDGYVRKVEKAENPAANEIQESSVLTLEQAKPITRSIVAQLGYPYQIFSSKAGYEEVMGAYEQAVLRGKQEGFTPVLVPADNARQQGS